MNFGSSEMVAQKVWLIGFTFGVGMLFRLLSAPLNGFRSETTLYIKSYLLTSLENSNL